MAIYCSNLFLYPSNTIDRASTVSGKSRCRCEVMIRRALNALKCACIICRWVMGESASTHDPYDPSKKTDPFDPLTHRPIVYSAGLRQFRYAVRRSCSWMRVRQRVARVHRRHVIYLLLSHKQPRLLHYTQGEVTSLSLWSRYHRHFVGITRRNALSKMACRVIQIKPNQLV